MSKYNFNPTPEQLADLDFWASDEVPEGAERFKPKCIDWFAQYLRFKDGHIQLLLEGCDQWEPVNVNHICAWHIAIKRPADPNALKRCPCGQVPNNLIIQELELGSRYKSAVPDCCTEWPIEFRAGYTKDDQEISRLANDSWNSKPRGFE